MCDRRRMCVALCVTAVYSALAGCVLYRGAVRRLEAELNSQELAARANLSADGRMLADLLSSSPNYK